MIGKVALTPVSPEPLPKKDPEKEPDIDTPDAPVVAKILPVPLIAVVDLMPNALSESVDDDRQCQ